jgi:hypothetical protein
MQIHPDDAFGEQMIRNLEVPLNLESFVLRNDKYLDIF